MYLYMGRVYSRQLRGGRNFPPKNSDAYTSACNFESMKSKTCGFAVNPIIIIYHFGMSTTLFRLALISESV